MIEQIFYGYMPNNVLSSKLKETFVSQCDKLGLEYTLHENFDHVEDTSKLYESLGTYRNGGPGGSGTASNFCSIIKMWTMAAKSNKTTAFFEHDCFPLVDFTKIEVPEDSIVCLGPRVPSLDYYTPKKQPTTLIKIKNHAGGHGYAMTPNTANKLLNHLYENGVQDSHDQWLFMRIKSNNITNYMKLDLYTVDPPPCVCVYGNEDGSIMETTRSAVDKVQPTYNFYETPGFIEGKK